ATEATADKTEEATADKTNEAADGATGEGAQRKVVEGFVIAPPEQHRTKERQGKACGGDVGAHRQLGHQGAKSRRNTEEDWQQQRGQLSIEATNHAKGNARSAPGG